MNSSPELVGLGAVRLHGVRDSGLSYPARELNQSRSSAEFGVHTAYGYAVGYAGAVGRILSNAAEVARRIGDIIDAQRRHRNVARFDIPPLGTPSKYPSKIFTTNEMARPN